MTVMPLENGRIEWQSFVYGRKWIHVVLDARSLDLLETSDEKIGNTLASLFRRLKENGYADAWGNGVSVRTDADFDMQWGLGSSSTLISLVAQWTGANAYDLQFAIFGGSGYDIACATASGPIIYLLENGTPVTQEAEFYPPFAAQLHFVYTGRKKDSRVAIAEFKATSPAQLSGEIRALDHITEQMLSCTDLARFEKLIAGHEEIIASTLKTKRIKDLRFAGYPGEIKSLGGWGGDFILATGDVATVKEFFSRHGLSTIFSFEELTKHRHVHA